ncbi:MAG TPA: CoA pyrophosphatase [Polyangiaceae bacterium]|nr:CoA pyrophosphatase [Polyangiaceae bacterium]
MSLPPFALHVRQRLDGRAPRPLPARGLARASVLVPIVCPPGGEPSVWLLRKRSDLRRHAGQVALPGGKIEPGETPLEAALRETHEEIGLAPEAVTVLGALDPYLTLTTTFLVSPFVGYVPHELRPSPDEHEVAHVFAAPLALFARSPTFRLRGAPGWPLPIAVYEVGGEVVWGLTAAILRGLARRVLGPGAGPRG